MSNDTSGTNTFGGDTHEDVTDWGQENIEHKAREQRDASLLTIEDAITRARIGQRPASDLGYCLCGTIWNIAALAASGYPRGKCPDCGADPVHIEKAHPTSTPRTPVEPDPSDCQPIEKPAATQTLNQRVHGSSP
jgi:hypothetical protein